jgi:hypothetical protein
MDKDPVCGMAVSRGDLAEKSKYQGRTYYFCSPPPCPAASRRPRATRASRQRWMSVDPKTGCASAIDRMLLREEDLRSF